MTGIVYAMDSVVKKRCRTMKQYVIDAFTDRVFGGNPAVYSEAEIHI